MPSGPDALAVALFLLPGWIYWRVEAQPRTARSALGELFEVVGAGAVATGVTLLAYVSLAPRLGSYLVDPRRMSDAFVREHLARASWSLATVVAVACLLAAAVALAQRKWRSTRDGERSAYLPETPLWVSALGGKPDTVVTVEMRDGRKVSGYLQGYDIETEGSPALFLSPPISLTSAEPDRGTGVCDQTEAQPFKGVSLSIPGSEVVAIWAPYNNES
jgi:hypothetical protein